MLMILFFFSSRRRHTRLVSDWSSDVCSSDLAEALVLGPVPDKSEHDRVRLWLGGLDPWALEAFDQGATFALIDKTTGTELAEVQQVDGTRAGLVSQGRLSGAARAADATTQIGRAHV